MVLIYAKVVPSKSAQRCDDFDELHLRSKLLIHMAKEKKDTMLLPIVAISELLVPVPRGQQGALIALLQSMFVCPTFDLPAASIAADLIARHRKLPPDQQYDERNVVRPDAMIVASARAAGATIFYTHDKRCRNLAGLIMQSEDLPTEDPSNPMFWRDLVSDMKPNP
jgi:hypothetical protein